MFYSFDVLDVLVGEPERVGAEPFHGEALELLDAEVGVLLEECDALPHTFHAVLRELLLGRRDGLKHVLHVGVEEHCAVNNAPAGFVVVGIARDLPTADEHIVILRGGSVQAECLEHFANHLHVLAERSLHLVGACDVAHHDVALVSIYAAATAFAAVELDAVLAAVGYVHLVLDDLMPAKDDCRLHLPEEKQVAAVVQGMGRILLHRQIEAEASRFVCWQDQMSH